MKKTIQELRNRLFSKEILSESDLLRLRGGDGEEDKRREVGRNFSMGGGFNSDGANASNNAGAPNGNIGSNPP